MYARKKGLKTSSGENTLAGNEFQERSFRTCSTASCGYFENVQGDENRCVDKKKDLQGIVGALVGEAGLQRGPPPERNKSLTNEVRYCSALNRVCRSGKITPTCTTLKAILRKYNLYAYHFYLHVL